jgi:5-(carboxyamino)imidazole ribonucleotide mutase
MVQATPQVGIIMGSQSDWPIMRTAAETLDGLGIAHEALVISAHRTPDRLTEYVSGARHAGLKVIIAGAGGAAALPGAAAALTPLPVFGVPIETKSLGGLDSLLSMAQMPGGIPVGTLAIGKAGAKNAALLAAAVLALSDEAVAKALDEFRAKQTAAVIETPQD